MQGIAIIPTIHESPYLNDLHRTLVNEHVTPVLVCNHPGHEGRFTAFRHDPWGPSLHRPGWSIYRTWNFGLRLGAYLDVPVLILNDDIILERGVASEMCRWIRHSSTYAILGFDYAPGDVAYDEEGLPVCSTRRVHGSYRHGGVGGFAFACKPRDCARVDRRFMWWGGDDDLFLATEQQGAWTGVLDGAKVRHPEPSLSARAHPELLPEGWAENDRALLVEKWDDGW